MQGMMLVLLFLGQSSDPYSSPTLPPTNPKASSPSFPPATSAPPAASPPTYPPSVPTQPTYPTYPTSPGYPGYPSYGQPHQDSGGGMSYTNVAVLTALATALGAVLAAVSKFVIPIIKLKSGESKDLRDMQIKSITEERQSLQEQSRAARDDMLRQIEQLRIELVKSQQLTLSLSVENATLRTRQQQAEAMLRQLQNQLALRSETISEVYTDGILTVDEHGTIIGMNRMISTIFGYSQDELLGHPLMLLIPEEFRAQHERAFQQQLHGKRELACIARSVRGVRKDGSYVDIVVTISKTLLQGRTVFTAVIREQAAVEELSPVTSAAAADVPAPPVASMITQVVPGSVESTAPSPAQATPPSFPPAQIAAPSAEAKP